jgi:hypothetical protein
MKLILHKTILRLLLSFTILTPFFNSAQVTLPHYEPINYSVGQALQSQTNWTVLNTGDDLLISSGSLSYPGLDNSTGNKVSFAGAGIDAAKLFTQQTSGTVYYSFLLNVTALGSLNTTGGYFTGFSEGSTTTFGATVWLRSDGAGYDIGINPKTTATNTAWTSGTTPLNSTVLVVVSYQMVAGTLNDVVRLWVNPVPGGAEPTVTASATNGVASDLVNINRILIRQDGTTATPSIEMDEFRIGTTWASVTPAPSTPTAPTVATLAASAISSSATTFNGTVNANNLSTTITFDYGTTTSYGTSVAASPNTLTSSTTEAVVATVSLSPNQQYHYRVVGTVSGTPTNGSDVSFFTLANNPNAPVVSNPTTNSLDVTIDTTAQNGNPIGTQYAISSGGQYVQANGSLGGSPVWQTAGAWATVTVGGLSSNTLYTFQLIARNGANVQATGGSASGTTSVNVTPTVTLNTALAGFGNVCTNISATSSFAIDAQNLDGTDLVVGALNGFSYSLTQNGTYTSTLNIPAGNTLSGQIIWVRFTPVAVQSYNGNIAITGGGLTVPFNVSATGSGVNSPSLVTGVAASGVTSTAAVMNGTATQGCTGITAYGIEYSTTNGFANGTGISVPATNLISGAFSVSVSTLSPNTTYYYKAFATDGSGTIYSASQQSFTTAAIGTPTALSASAIQPNSFVANWNAIPGATSYRLDVSTSPVFGVTNNSADLFISEYVEGSSNNKVIEIYNGTGNAVNLSGYSLRKQVNGAGAFGSELLLAGSVNANSTYVIANSSSSAAILSIANLSTSNQSLNFNGNDAVALYKNGSQIDVVGVVNQVALWGENMTLVRKASVVNPTVSYTINDWNSLPIDTINNLGSHTINNTTPSFVPGYENLIVNGTSQLVTGLTENTNYYYRVRAASANSTSGNSIVITVQTAPAPPTFSGIAQVVGVVCENTSATFNVTGLLPDSTSTISFNIDGGATQTVTGVVSNGSGFATFDLVLSLANNSQTLTVTSVQRTDVGSEVLNVTTNNTALLSVNENTTYYADSDNDGFGDINSPITACEPLAGYVTNNTDCNDTIGAINPGHGEVLYNGVDDNCDGNLDEGFQYTTNINPSQCGTTLSTINSYIVAIQKQFITSYRFEVTNTATNAVQTIIRTQNYFSPTMLATYDYATTYSVRVEIQRNGVWLGYYGPACLVSTPAVLAPGGAATITPGQCGSVIPSISTLIATTSIANVTGYRFRVTNASDISAPNQIQIIDRGDKNWFALTMLSTYNYGTTYLVEVSIKTNNGQYSAFGSPCAVTAPAVPMLTNCGQAVATKGTLVSVPSKDRVTAYRFEITNLTTNLVTTLDRNQNWFTFNNVPNVTPGGPYAVRVKVLTSGVFSLYGEACEITAPAGLRTMETSAEFKAVAYPNPFTANFSINVNTVSEENMDVKVYDMTGRIIETRNASLLDMQTLQIGEFYPSGVYNVILTQGKSTAVLRVVKR